MHVVLGRCYLVHSIMALRLQVLVASLPVGLASVDCNGTEASLLDCTSSQNDLQQCGIADTNLTDATVLTCANTADSALSCMPDQTPE